MYQTGEAHKGFHTKGYIFKKEEIYHIIVGSSNMTMSALTTNKEWNTRIVSTENGEYVLDIVAEFEDLWDSPYAQAYDDFIEQYKIRYEIIKKQRKIAKQEQLPSVEAYRLQPNSMQVNFIANLQKMRAEGEHRALLISATGDGGIIMTSQAKTA